MAEVGYVAAFDYDPQGQAGCIALTAGEAVVVTDASREDWWIGYRAAEPSAEGAFPKAFMKAAPAADASDADGEAEKAAANADAKASGGQRILASAHHSRVTGVEFLAKLPPISGWEDQPLVSLPKATEHLPVKSIKRHAQIALEVGEDYKEDHPDDPRTPDQLGAVHLYTQGWAVVEHSLYVTLNTTLSDRDRAKLTVWFLFIKLLMTALACEPMHVGNVWRGVKADIGSQYVKGKKVRWWRFSSCTTNGDVLNNDLFLGTTGKRTVFSIDCKTGVKVKHLSAYEAEDEVLLAAGTRFLVANTLTNGDLTIVNLKEVESGLPVSEDIPPETEAPAPPASAAAPAAPAAGGEQLLKARRSTSACYRRGRRSECCRWLPTAKAR
jgi:hypothetical protein